MKRQNSFKWQFAFTAFLISLVFVRVAWTDAKSVSKSLQSTSVVEKLNNEKSLSITQEILPKKNAKLKNNNFWISPYVVTLPRNIILALVPSLSQICAESLQQKGSLEDRLSGCPLLMNQMVWETGAGERIHYQDWPAEKKERLNVFFERLIRNEADLGINCPEAISTMPSGPSGQLGIYLTAEQAFNMYAAQVAHVFYVEIMREVPWSILNDSPQELEEFFASYQYHSRIMPSAQLPESYPAHINPNRDFQRPFRELTNPSLVCDPRDAKNFLRGLASSSRENLIGATDLETLKNMTWWFHRHVVHASPNHRRDYYSTNEQVAAFAYLRDRLRVREGSILSIGGCHTTTNLFYDLAKGINIPLKAVRSFQLEPDLSRPAAELGHINNVTHSGLVFHASHRDTRILLHSDYINAVTSPIFPIQESPVLRALTSTESAQLLFNQIWVTPEELARSGFNYLGLNLIRPGTGYGILSSRAYEDKPDFGYLIGYWLRSCVADNSFVHIPCLISLSGYERSFQLCSWPGLLEVYCSSPESFSRQMEINLMNNRAASMGYVYPYLRSGREYEAQMVLCAEAYGGCTQIRNRVSSILREMGNASWVNE